MPADQSYRSFPKPSLAFVLLCLMFVVLWVGGGASRADVFGQVVVRGAAWAILVFAAIWAERPNWRRAPAPIMILFSAALLVSVQLIPLPPNLWEALPGRSILTVAAKIAGEAQPWRPIAIVPSAALNALSSLVVPFTILLLAIGLRKSEEDWSVGVLLALVIASTLVGLLQFTGVGFDHPLINDTPGDVNGGFANRNHFALFLAIGCLVAPVWALSGGRRWRLPVALGLVLLFVLTILATGSRAGMLLGVIALATAVPLARKRLTLYRAPRWLWPLVLIGLVSTVGLFVLLSVMADRAASIDRAFALDAAQDMRARGLPTVLTMLRTYFPIGAGFGGFDPIFRMFEPFELLKPSYFNHAHNDYLEVILDGGLAGGLLLGAALLWWAFASVRAWRKKASVEQLGSAILLLVLVASITDYPARTPMVMAVVALSGVWLSGRWDTAK